MSLKKPTTQAIGETSKKSVFYPEETRFHTSSETNPVQDAFDESQSFLDLALQSACMGIWQWDIKEDKRYFDGRTCQILGIDTETFDGTSDEFYSIVHPDDQDALKIALQKAIDLDILYEPEYRVIWPDNSLHYITARGKLIRDKEGKPLKIDGLIWDVSDRKKEEKAIRRKGELLKMTSQLAKIGGWEFNAKTKKGTWTDEVARIHDLNPEDEINVELGISFYLPDSRQKIEAAIKEAIDQAKPYDLELELISADNKHKWIRAVGLPVIKNNEVVKVEGLFQDITDRKLIELELNDSKQQLRFALEGSNDGIWDIQMTTGSIYLSPRGCEILGYPANELNVVIKVWSELVHPDDLPETNKKLKAHIDGETSVFEVEQRLHTKSGDWKWILTRGKVVTRDIDGSPLRMTGTHTDISKRKKAEEAMCEAQQALQHQNEEYQALNEELNESNNRIRAINQDLLLAKEKAELSEHVKSEILEKLNETEKIAKIGSWEWNFQTFEVWWSDQVYRIFELDPESYMPNVETNAQFIHPDDRDSYHRNFFDCIETGSLLNYDVRIITPSGKIKNCKVKGKVYFDADGDPLRFSGIMQDFTLQVQIQNELLLAKEKAEESDRLKSTFLCNMSHEIRTPMNAIIGFSELLTMPALSDSQKENFVSVIKERSLHLLHIVEDILDISKIEVGQMTIFESDFDLFELLDNTYKEYSEKLQKSRAKSAISLEFEIDNNLGRPLVKSDEKRLAQVLGYLLDNAIKFTHQGSIKFGCKPGPGSELIFFVRDTGIGIPVDKRHIIFDYFRQADEAITTRLYDGPGLGLSIAKGIITLLKGRIWFDSKVGEGTTFWFSLPTEILKPILQGNNISPSNINKIRSIKNILLVEDDALNAEYFKMLLTASGFNVLYASNGKETLDLFRNNPSISLILMDINLPDTNGLILTQVVKQEKPEVIVIAQTAYTSSANIQNCIEAGCDDYIAKPIKSESLISMINRYLNK